MHNRVVHPRGAAGVTVSCEEGMHITDDGVHMFYRLANPEGAGFPLVMVQVRVTELERGSSEPVRRGQLRPLPTTLSGGACVAGATQCTVASPF